MEARNTLYLRAKTFITKPNCIITMMMKRMIFACALALCLCATARAAGNPQSLMKSFLLEVWDDVSPAELSSDGHTAIIRHIADGSLVTGVNYQLADGATITPDPKTLIGKWPKEVTFTLKQKKRTEQYKVVLTDFVPREEQAGGKWKLVWSDEFNGNHPDWGVWSKVPRDRGNWCDDMTDDDRLFEMKDGLLSLKGMANTILPNDTSKYLTGGLWGKDKRAFMLGKIEVRARFSCAKGFWPAIWLLPQEESNRYSDHGELDMMEHLNFDNYAYQTAHTEYTNLVNKTNPKNHYMPPIDRDGFNVYSVEVYPDSVVYSVNGGAASYTYPRIKPAVEKQFPFDHYDYYVILSAQLGGQWVGEVSLKPQEVVKMDIDYVRYYRQK